MRTGGWRSAVFIIAAEIGERFAFYAVASTLITYLTGPLQEGIAAAAAATNVWNGTALMLPLLGGAIADLWLGRYLTIVLASLLYILGLGLLAVSTLVGQQHCNAGEKCPPPPTIQVVLFYVSLYTVAVGEGGHKPCAHAFGADQFSGSDPGESVSRGAFFNWWYFGVCAGTVATLLVVSYVQENLGWGLGFAVPCAVMACALVVFLLGTRTYRHTDTYGTRNLFAHAAEAFAACRRRQRQSRLGAAARTSRQASRHGVEVSAEEPPEISSSSRVDEEAQVATTTTNTAVLVSETRAVLRLLPIWATTLVYAVVYSQSMTFFTKQAATLDRRVGELAKVPAAALLAFISVTIMALIPVYDRVVVPLARRYTGRPSGITMLQRIGAGMLLSVASTVTAALVEARRLRVARDAGLLADDRPGKAVQQLPMSLWWMVPQYVVFGAADVFAMVGLQEFFYDQVPDRLRSVGLALYISVFGVGSFVSSALVSGTHRATAARGQSWFSDNMNGGHLDYFYWLLAALSGLQFFAYVFVAWRYKYKNAGAEHT